MVEEEKDAAGNEVMTPPGMHRPEHMAVDVPEGTDYPQGVNPTGEVNPTNEDEASVPPEGGGSETGLKVPGPGGTR
jgi:hypothetical protein